MRIRRFHMRWQIRTHAFAQLIDVICCRWDFFFFSIVFLIILVIEISDLFFFFYSVVQFSNLQMSAHKQRYKNVGLDSTEMRRRREEEGIQLRKQKREQQLIKRRNVDNFPTMDSETENTITVSDVLAKCIDSSREFL